ncbi:TetR/AcrR family transcriptional regulator [Streptomyces sp. HNM0574]|uniref:TetR/AcrR family transcriptional regulator n=1 Tax=Streptomyces sp. HNM0574 TaxID=2714954 RepID=UPI00146AFC90|nr:TetR/AcrR family transcriptional regulator [Streptomyces sp. HNM0574]NLU69821.1 TetR/AcrR family transcriptional regulator [Streptomyces sp. HNM0574]
MAETAKRAGVDGRSTRWNAHKARRQAEILDAAMAAVEEHGPHVGVQRIAERIGLPRSVVYRHFKDRADLDELIRQRVMGSLMAELAPALEPDGTVISSIRRSVDAYLGWVTAHPRLHAFLGAGSGRPTGRSRAVADTKAAITVRTGDVFAGLLGAFGKDAGLAPSIASGLVGFVDATVNNWLSGKGRTGGAPDTEELAEFLTCSIWAVLDGNLRRLGVELSPDHPVSDLPGA